MSQVYPAVQFEWQNPLVQVLSDRLTLCRQPPVDLAMPVQFAGLPYEQTCGEWLEHRVSELGWIEKSLERHGFVDDVPATGMRLPSRDAALFAFINLPRPHGARWPLHYAAGLYWHTLETAELLLWPDFLKSRELADAP